MRKNQLARLYAAGLTLIAPLYKTVYQTLLRARTGKSPKRIILLISRTLDVELLVGLQESAQDRQDIHLSYWISQNCIKRNPGILGYLKESRIPVDLIVSPIRLGTVLNRLMQAHAFLTVVESTTARHKLPYLITVLANAAGVATFTMQHGFENVGLTYCDGIHGPDVKFAAKAVLTWGPVEGLPTWVGKDTREKCVAVGCPKRLVIAKNDPSVKPGERPIIGIFDNLHWHRYNKRYVDTFLDHLETMANSHPNFRFILKSHPESIRNRSEELTTRLSSMQNVEVADLVATEKPELTTPWLLSHALGIITTPSTIALDSALAGVPVAVTRYGLDLDYYSPLNLLDNLDDWQGFLNCLGEASSYIQLKLVEKEFLGKVLFNGDPESRILDTLAR